MRRLSSVVFETLVLRVFNIKRRTQGWRKISRQRMAKKKDVPFVGMMQRSSGDLSAMWVFKDIRLQRNGYSDDSSNEYCGSRCRRNWNMSTSMQSHPIPFRIELFVPVVDDLGGGASSFQLLTPSALSLSRNSTFVSFCTFRLTKTTLHPT